MVRKPFWVFRLKVPFKQTDGNTNSAVKEPKSLVRNFFVPTSCPLASVSVSVYSRPASTWAESGYCS